MPFPISKLCRNTHNGICQRYFPPRGHLTGFLITKLPVYDAGFPQKCFSLYPVWQNVQHFDQLVGNKIGLCFYYIMLHWQPLWSFPLGWAFLVLLSHCYGSGIFKPRFPFLVFRYVFECVHHQLEIQVILWLLHACAIKFKVPCGYTI